MLTVRRGNGDKPAKDVIDDPFLEGIEPMMIRGRYEIDLSELKPISLNVVINPNLRKGQIVAISDSFSGITIYGVISSVEYRYSEGKPSMQLEVLRK